MPYLQCSHPMSLPAALALSLSCTHGGPKLPSSTQSCKGKKKIQAQKVSAEFILLLKVGGDVGRQGGLYRDLMTRPSPFEAGLLYCVTLWLPSGTHGFSFSFLQSSPQGD